MKEWSSGLKLDDVLQMNAVKRYKDIAEMDNRKVSTCLSYKEKIKCSTSCYSLNHKLRVISILVP